MSFRRPAGSIRRPRARSEKREPRPDRKGDLAGVSGRRQVGTGCAVLENKSGNPSTRSEQREPRPTPSRPGPETARAEGRGVKGRRLRRFNSKTPALVPGKREPRPVAPDRGG